MIVSFRLFCWQFCGYIARFRNIFVVNVREIVSELFEIGFDIEFFCLPAFLVARCRKQDILMVEKLCSSAIHHPQYRTIYAITNFLSTPITTSAGVFTYLYIFSCVICHLSKEIGIFTVFIYILIFILIIYINYSYIVDRYTMGWF